MMKYKKLSEIAEVRGGGTPKRSVPEYWERGEIPWVKISDIKEKYVRESEEFITKKGLEESSAKLFAPDTILYTIFATIGEVAILEVEATTNQAIAGIKITDDIVRVDFIYYYLLSLKEKMINQSRGVAQNNINLTMLRELVVPIPSIKRQDKIITVLRTVEKVLEQRNKQLQELDNLIRSIFFETIDNINYENISFGDAFDLIDGDRGKNYPKKSDFTNNGYCLFLNTKNVTKKGFSFEETEFISKEKDEVLRSGKVEYGDFILTTRGTVGNVTYYNEKIPYENIRINSGMLILRPKIEIDERYFQILIRELPILELAISGSAQPQLPKGRLIELEFPIIDQNKQVLFSEKVKEIESVKAKMEESLNEMKTLFDALMQKAFTGELV